MNGSILSLLHYSSVISLYGSISFFVSVFINSKNINVSLLYILFFIFAKRAITCAGYGLMNDVFVEYQAIEENEKKDDFLASEEDDYHPIFRRAPSSVEFNKLRKRLLRHMRQALDDFSMLSTGKKWLVALSGGKDSYGLLALLLDLKWRGLLPVEILACNLDQGQPGFPKHILPDFLSSYKIPYRIEY